MLGGRKTLQVVCSSLLALCFLFAETHGQELLLDSGQIPKTYLIELSGTVLNERFTDATALLTISAPGPLSLNRYTLVIVGYPKRNSRNTFYWNSDDSYMTTFPNEIACEIKRSFVNPPDIHFFYLSPALLEKRVFLTQREGERKKMAEKTALPSKVLAQSGRLDVKVLTDRVTGSIRLKGYDPIEHSYVQYSAQFQGRKTFRLKPRIELKK